MHCRRSWSRTALIAGLTGALVSGGCRSTVAGTDDGFPHTAAVLAALAVDRPYVLRLSDTPPPAACVSSDSASSRIPSVRCRPVSARTTAALAALAVTMAADTQSSTSTDRLWAMALVDLAGGTPDVRQVERGIRSLTEVRSRAPRAAGLLGQLALAHWLRAGLRQDVRELFESLDLLEQAWMLDSTSVALGYDRAQTAEVLRLNRSAAAQWALLAARERDAGWRAEIARRRVTLQRVMTRPAATSDPQTVREMVFDSILPRWATHVTGGDSAGAAALAARADSLGSAVLLLHGDSTVWHQASALHRAPARAVAAAITTLVDGTRRFRATDYGAAAPMLASASATLRHAGADAVADWAQIYAAGVQVAVRDFRRAGSTIDGIIARARDRGDRALVARALIARGIVVGRAGALDRAEADFVDAMREYGDVGERRSQAQAAIFIADAQGLAGRARDAATTAFQGYVASSATAGVVAYEALLAFAQQLTDGGWHAAAARVLDEALLATRDTKRAKDRPETLGRLAIVQVAMGQVQRARATLTAARGMMSTVTDSAMRDRLRAELDRAESAALAEDDPRGALQRLDAASTHFRRIPSDLTALLLRGGRLAAAAGDTVRAERMLDSAVTLGRTLAPTATGAQARELLAASREARRTLIELALGRGDTLRAFTRTVALSALGAADSASDSHPPALADGHAELRLVTLPRGVITWLRTSRGIRVHRAPVSRDSLQVLVRRFVNLLRSGTDGGAGASVAPALTRALLGGLAPALADRVVDVYSDGELAVVPLGLLPDAAGHLLLERTAFEEAVPTVSAARASGKTPQSGPLLIADPLWRRGDFPVLEPLRQARGEVAAIASLDPRSVVLADSGATRPRMRDAMPQHAVLHFAGHALVVRGDPGRSHLVLAAGSTFAGGVLYASEIAAMPLGGVRLVVLSACGSLDDEAVGADGVNPLATAFLDAGSGAVVAGRWEVDDADAGALMAAFHRAVRSGMEPARALQQASVALLGAGRSATRLSTVAAFGVAVRAPGAQANVTEVP